MAQDDVVKLYESGLTIRKIATQTGLSVHMVRKALIVAGTVFRGSRGKKPSREEVVRVYLEEGGAERAAKRLGVSADFVQDHARAAGVLKPRGGNRKYAYNAEFFDAYTAASCYWAGFLAADGGLVLAKGAHRIQVNLKRTDRSHLMAFQRCAEFGHPVSDVVFGGYDESRITISSREWWVALHERFNLTQRKSMTLQPPPDAMGEEMTWHYVRGYFDGDGSVTKAEDDKGYPKQMSFVSGSREFIEWIRRFMGSHHKIGATGRAWRFALSGDVMRRTVPLMYAGSTPETRLDRKYQRLKRWVKRDADIQRQCENIEASLHKYPKR